jgi:hypothetical protein
MPMPDTGVVRGANDCRHWKGIKDITYRTCCGGVQRERVKILCCVHKHIYGDHCRSGVCREYERADNGDGQS